jgi:crotonobetainyl-CoA:carnitine CoA-transferase CaiB-like acyl-CoA transferase
MAPKFLHLNRNKRSICLDLKHPDGQAVLQRLLREADILAWNVRPASMARLGLDYEAVKAINPRIIYCGMFGFGQDGPYADAPAYDPIIQGMSGVAGLHAKAFGEPRFVPYVMADRTSGLIAVQMIAMALFHRERTGEGVSIEVPMFENMATQVLCEHLYLRTYQPALGEAGDPRLVNPYYAPSPTKDGYICISANTNPQVFPLLDAMGLAHLKTDPRFCDVAARFANVHEFYRVRDEALKQQSTAFWLEVCRTHDIPAAPYNTLDSLMEDPHLKQVGLLVEREHPTEGRILDVRQANQISVGSREDWIPAPHLGEHTVQILREAGLSAQEVDALLHQGVAQQATLPTP